MRYEIVPNILCDDETINLRIPLTEENARRSDVQYLCSKYSNNYSIYNVPYTYVGGGFESLPKKLYYDSAFSLPESKEIIVFAIVFVLVAKYTHFDLLLENNL